MDEKEIEKKERLKPLLTISSDRPTGYSGLTFDVDYFEQDNKTKEIFLTGFTEGIYNKLKEKVLTELPSVMSPKNFEGAASNYMAAHGVPFNKITLTKYSQAIYEDFMASLDKTVTYDEADGFIKISPYVYSLELGDFYSPALQFLSKTVSKWAREIKRD